MQKLKFLILPFFFLILSCGDDQQCQECSGTVTNTGETADWTVCEEDGAVTQTNNITGVSMETNNDYVGSIAFLISLGLECED